MANAHKYTKADLRYIYKDILGHEGASQKDVDKLMKSLPESFTLDDLRKASPKGFGNKASTRLQDVLSYIGEAETAAPPPPPTTSVDTTNTTGNTGINPSSFGYNPSKQMDPRANDKIRVEDYTPGFGDVGNALKDFLMKGNSAQFGGRAEPNPYLGGRAPWEKAPFSAPPTFAETYLQKQLQGFRPSGPSQLEQSLTNMAMRGPQGLTPAASSFENMLSTMAQNPYLMSLAQGQIPQVMQDSLNNQLALSQANTLEGMGAGQGSVSSDLAQYLNRTESDARTNFLADMASKSADVQGLLANIAGAGGGLANQRMGMGASMYPSLLGTGIGAEQSRRAADVARQMGYANPLLGVQSGANENALQRFLGTFENQAGRQFGAEQNAISRMLGLGSGLFGAEESQRGQGQQMMYQDYLRSLGLPPEMAALLSLMGMGGGTTKSTGTSTTGMSGGGGLDLLNALGQLGGTAATFGMGGMGPLAGLLGGGGGKGGGNLAGLLGSGLFG
jgi:hypothetical protein